MSSRKKVEYLSGERYSHNKPNKGRYSRWVVNKATLRIGSKKVLVIGPRG